MKKYSLLLLGLVISITIFSYSLDPSNNKEVNDNKDEYTSKQEIIVPDVSGMTEKDAINILELNKVEIGEIFLVTSTKYEEGLVVKTEPIIGSTIKENTLVNLYISTNSLYVLEDFVGKNYVEAKTKLEYLDLVVEIREKASLVEHDDLTIIEQEPVVGTALDKGDKVILYISRVDLLYPDFVSEK